MKNPKSRSTGLQRKPTVLTLAAACAVSQAFILSPSEASVVVDLDATALSVGPLGTWVNPGVDEFGDPVGDFTSAGTDVPEVVTKEGVNAVQLDNAPSDALKTTYYNGPPVPFELEADGARTFEAWVFDDGGLQPEKNVIAWGRTSATGRNSAFGYGTDQANGAVSFWGGGNNLSYAAGSLVESRWVHVAVVYDPATNLVRSYIDGLLSKEETAGPLATDGFDSNFNPIPMRIGRQNSVVEGDAIADPALGVGTIALGRIRIHSTALTGEELRTTALAEGEEVFWPDSDGGGLPDWYETQLGLNINDAADDTGDLDEDLLTNLDEFLRGTLADNKDSDGDGAEDGAEVNRMEEGNPAPTDPLNPDTDGDGLNDGGEVTAGTDPFDTDSDNDTYTDGQEVAFGTDPLDPNDFPGDDRGPIVNLDATTLAAGPLEAWMNNGALGGEFVPNVTAADVEVQAGGIPGLALKGSIDSIYVGPPSPTGITGNGARTAEAWILNPEIANEEAVVSWGQRGSAGMNNVFGHGYSLDFGAFGGWSDAFDNGWGPPEIPNPTRPDRMVSGNLTENAWTHIAFTYSPDTFELICYRDGEVANTEPGIDLLTAEKDSGGNPLPILIGGQNNAGAPDRASNIVFGKVKVYDRALSAEEVKASFDADAAFFIPPSLGIIITGISYDSASEPNTVTITWNESAIPEGSTITLQTSGALMNWVNTSEVLAGGTHTFVPLDPENPGDPIDSDRFYRFLIEEPAAAE